MTRRNRKRSEASSEGGLAIDKLLEEIRDEKEKEYETVDDLNKGGIDAHPRCRKRLRTTGALDIFGHFRAGPAALPNGAVASASYDFAGNGILGAFTFHSLSASAPAQAPPASNCAIYGSVVVGEGVFRFADGSLLMVNSAQGSDCRTIPAHRPGGPLHQDFQDCGWNRPVQECTQRRDHYLGRNARAGIAKQPHPICCYGHGNDFRGGFGQVVFGTGGDRKGLIV